MNKPHPLKEFICAWAEGKTVQFRTRGLSVPWIDYAGEGIGFGTADLPNTRHEWRVKPETVKYRRYLYKTTARELVVEACDPARATAVENYSGFVRWIDTEWQEVEV